MISAVILTKNEEKNIEDCLNTLKWCDEVIVIDDNSVDETVKIVEKLGAKVFKRELGDDFAAQRNFGLEKAQNAWVLFVDADERVSPTLRAEITKNIENENNTFNGYYLKREDKIWGRNLKYGETANVKLLRLGKKGWGRWEGLVHEEWHIAGQVGNLQSPLQHYPHSTLSEFLQEINFYSTIRAKELYLQKRKTSLMEIILYPKVKFLQNYLGRFGFRDGMPGFSVALLMSFHSFLVRSKLYLLWKQEGTLQ